MNDLWIYEQQYTENGSLTVAGVDEAGRGPLAGPVFAAAVILPFGTEIDGLNDSKKLSEAKREKLFDIITDKAVRERKGDRRDQYPGSDLSRHEQSP